MANKNEHLQIIEENCKALAHLSHPNPDDYSEWCVVIIYYMAFHYINAYLAQKRDLHPASHANLKPQMKDKPLNTLYSAYRNLEDDSRDARYDGRKFSINEIKQESIVWFDTIQNSVSGWLKIPAAKQHNLSGLF